MTNKRNHQLEIKIIATHRNTYIWLITALLMFLRVKLSSYHTVIIAHFISLTFGFSGIQNVALLLAS